MRKVLIVLMAAVAVLAGVPLGHPGALGQGWQDGVWRGAGWEWRGGPGWAGRWAWRRGTVGPGWGGFYPGPGYYPFGFPYGYAYPYTTRGTYGCFRPVPLDAYGRTFARERVC